MSRNSRIMRKCHAARRRTNRLRRDAAAEADLARRVETADACGAGRAADAQCAVGCAFALAAAAALLIWYAWFK